MKRVYWILMVFAASSCTADKAVNEEEFRQWVQNPNNGLSIEERRGEIMTTVQYKPVELVIAQEVKGMHVSASGVEAIRKNYDSLDYFVLRISRNGHEIENGFAPDPALFTDAVSYLNGGISDDIRLKVNERWIAPEYVVYPRTFGSSTASSLMVIFKSALLKQAGDVVFVWEDSKLRTGNHTFEFKRKHIEKIPLLKL